MKPYGQFADIKNISCYWNGTIQTHIHIIFTFTSMLICIALIAEGARSYFRIDNIIYQHQHWTSAGDRILAYAEIDIREGHVSLLLASGEGARRHFLPDGDQLYSTHENRSLGWDDVWSNTPRFNIYLVMNSFARFGCGREYFFGEPYADFPIWLPILLSALLPAQWLQKRLRKLQPAFPIETSSIPA